jgi:hypothetical protein
MLTTEKVPLWKEPIVLTIALTVAAVVVLAYRGRERAIYLTEPMRFSVSNDTCFFYGTSLISISVRKPDWQRRCAPSQQRK